MMKYPIGVQDFEKLIDEGYAYVDKTELVYKIATTGHIYFMCRPRRFGKSLLISTLKAYFEGKRELFRGLAIEGLEKEWCQSQGRVDCVVECPNDIYVIEFKLNGTADDALQQIQDRGYATEYLQDPRTLHHIGCVFLSASGTIGDWKTL